MYPAMVRAYRAGGVQFASMFAYDQLETAPFNLGWQTHFLNLVHSPRKAVSAVIAAEAMRRLPRFQFYGRYPDDTRFGDFRVNYENDLSELIAADAYMNAGPTQTPPRDPKSLNRIVGYGSSPVVAYEGTGAYFLDKVRDGVWRLEVYPDEILVRDPFEQPRPDKIVSRLVYRTWPMQVNLPDLGDHFTATPVTVPQDAQATPRQAGKASVAVEPGIWMLSAQSHIDKASLPEQIARVGFDEFHVNAPVNYPDLVLSLVPKTFEAGTPIEIRARVASMVLPDETKLWMRPLGSRNFGAAIAMHRVQGNDYAADAGMLVPGLYEYAISTTTGGHSTTFPGTAPRQPDEWPFLADTGWSFQVTSPRAPLRLFNPKEDVAQLSFVRPHEVVRNGLFRIVPGGDGGEFALDFGVPDLGADTPDLYAAALYVGDTIEARKADAGEATALSLIFKGHAKHALEVALIEKDGAAWHATIPADGSWQHASVPLRNLKLARSLLIPTPFPGLWDYWRAIPQHRGGTGDHLHMENVERLELSVHRSGAPKDTNVAIQSVGITFDGTRKH
jgi:hypothetical protein